MNSMGAAPQNPNIGAALDSATCDARLRLHLDIVIPRERFIELATLMEAERFHEAEALMVNLRPDTSDDLNLFFSKALRQRSLPARQAA
jgi:hypothetical protein